MRILLVEDCDDLRESFFRLLTRGGFIVHDAADRQEALDNLRLFQPQAVVTDLAISCIDGIELIRVIRSPLGSLDLPAVAITASTSIEKKQMAYAVRASDFIAKPVDFEVLTTDLETAAATALSVRGLSGAQD